MRPIVLRVFLPLIFLVCTLKCHAQTCNGSLGDPVIDENFGSGANPGPPLAPGVTAMTYTNSGCPNDGYYTIASNVSGTCFGSTWQNVPADHTGNANGYMMVINASFQPSVFFTQAANGLCPNTTYEFAAWILNLNLPSACEGSPILANITFTIQTTDGTVLQTYNTGNIPTTNPALPVAEKWKQYGTYFTTPSNTTDVVVTMFNNATGGCGNDLCLDDITFRACGPIIEEGFSSTAGPSNKSLCQGSNAAYTLDAHVIGNGTPAYQWQSNNNGNGWTDIKGANDSTYTASFVNAVVGAFQYRVGVANGSSITSVDCRVYAPPLTVTVNPLPVVPPISGQTLCVGDQLQLTASGGATYTWTGPGISATSQNPLVINSVIPANAGTFSVVAVSDSGCAAAPVNVQVSIRPQVMASVQNSTLEVCAGEAAQLSASGGSYYKWSPSTGLDNDTLSNPTATPLQTTTYTVDVSNGGCSDSSQTVTVTVNQNPVADAGNEIILFEGQSAKLKGSVTGSNITGYSWSPATFLSDPTSLNPIATPTDNITYTLTAVSSTCGTSTSTVFVRVYKKITIPNTFSPNNDGINDYWDIDALVTYPESIIQVFDRYGQPVYQSTGYAKPWNGADNGKPLPVGTYYYIIDLKNGTPKLAGWVLIVR